MLRAKRLAIRIAIFIAILFLAIWLPVHYLYFNFHPILSGQAYRSAQPSPAFLEKVVQENHIQSILKFNRAVESSWSQEEFTEAKKLGVEMFYIPIGVSELPTRPDMIRIISALDHAPRPILVHCKTGADRTGLASVLLAMQAGESFEQAKDTQLRLRFGHIGHLGDDVDDILTQYDSDRTAEGKNIRTYTDFRDYIRNEYYPDFYHAGIAPEQTTLAGHPGQIVTFHVKVTNLSPRPWSSWLFPFRLNLGIPNTRSGNYPNLLTHAHIGWHLDPGQSILINLPVKIPPLPPGLHRYTLDIAQVLGSTFAHFGSPTVDVYLNVEK